MRAKPSKVNFAINLYPKYFFCIHVKHNNLTVQKKYILSYIIKNLTKVVNTITFSLF